MVLCGGSESMSQAPYAVRNIRFGTRFGVDLKVGFWLIFVYFLISKSCDVTVNTDCYLISEALSQS